MAERRVFTLVGLVLAAACSSDDSAGPASQPPDDASLIDWSAGDSGKDAAKDQTIDKGSSYTGPAKLSETGQFSDIPSRTLADGVRAYDVRQPVWVDGVVTKHFLYLPPGQKIDTSIMDVWKFPIGTKSWRELYVSSKLVETRFMWKQAEGDAGWIKVSFQWNSSLTDAVAVPDGVQNVDGTDHDIPSVADCEQCHNGQGDGLIGVAAIQLSKDGGGGFLTTLINDGLLTNPPAGEFDVPGTGAVKDSLIYLHANCGHCHNDENYLAQKRYLRLKLKTAITTPEQTPTYQTCINAKMNHVLASSSYCIIPGKPAESQLYVRMNERNIDMMPTLDTEVVDTQAMTTISDWITALPP